MVTLVAGVDRSCVDRLAVDHSGTDNESDGHGELRDHEHRAKPSRAGRFRRRTIRLEDLRRLETRQEERRVKPADDPNQQSERDCRQQHPAAADVLQCKVGIEEGRERPHQQFHQSQCEQHRNARYQDRLRDELDDELTARGSEHLAQRDLTGTLAGAGSSEVGEVHHRHAENEQGDDRERRDRAAVVARSHRPALRLAEVHVLEIDEMPVLVVTLVEANAAVRLIWDVAFLPRGFLGLQLRDVGAGPKLQIDPSRLAAPASQELRFLGKEGVEVHPQDRADLKARILRNVLQHAGDLEVARDAF